MPEIFVKFMFFSNLPSKFSSNGNAPLLLPAAGKCYIFLLQIFYIKQRFITI